MSSLEKNVAMFLYYNKGWQKERSFVEHEGNKYYFYGQKYRLKQVLDICLQDDPFEHIFRWYTLHEQNLCGSLCLIVRSDYVKKKTFRTLRQLPVHDLSKKIRTYSLKDIGFMDEQKPQQNDITKIFIAHLNSPTCIRQFLFPQLLKKGAFLTTIYLRSLGFNEEIINHYFKNIDKNDYASVITWVFDNRLTWDKAKCNVLQSQPEEGKKYQMKIGDLPSTTSGCKDCERNLDR